MDKEILIQYSEMIEEIKDIRRRQEKLKRKIKDLEIVSDSVRGTRPDGTKKAGIERYQKQLEFKEAELLELTCQAEEYIENIEKSEVRIMLRLYYIDGLPWWKVAQTMNRMFPKRRVNFTEDSCRMRNNRIFKENL